MKVDTPRSGTVTDAQARSKMQLAVSRWWWYLNASSQASIFYVCSVLRPVSALLLLLPVLADCIAYLDQRAVQT